MAAYAAARRQHRAGGIQLTPLGFARFGELHRNYGRWNGETVVAADWVDAMMRPAVDTTVEGNRYGYLWWHKSYRVGDDEWPVTYCSGNGGNKIFVFDRRELVVVVTASAYGQPLHAQPGRRDHGGLLSCRRSATRESKRPPCKVVASHPE